MSQNAFAQIERETNEAEALREHTRIERMEMEELNTGYEFTKAKIAELESLRAWKAEIEKQDPVGTVIYRKYKESTRFGYIDHRIVAIDYGDNKLLIGQPLYAAPVVSPDVAARIAELEAEVAESKVEFNQCSGLLDDALRSIEIIEEKLKVARDALKNCIEFEKAGGFIYDIAKEALAPIGEE